MSSPVLGEPPVTVRCYHDSGPQSLEVTRFVLHDEEFPVGTCSAEDVANFFTSSQAGGSVHYIFDGDGEIHTLPENTIAWHAPPNDGSLGGEHDGYAHFTREQWLQPGSLATLHWSARRVADICVRYNLPIVRIGVPELLNGDRGLCSHIDVTNAWHQSDHTDPGDSFPWDVYLALVQARANPPVSWTVHPMYDPPQILRTIVASAGGSPGGCALVADDGSVYCYGTPFHGGCNGQPFWGTRMAREIRVDASGGYTILDTAGEFYDFGYPQGVRVLRWTDCLTHPAVTLRPIRCVGSCPGGAVLVGDDGSIYTFGSAQFHGGPNGQAYWGQRVPAEIRVVSSLPQKPYTLKAATGEYYDYGYNSGEVHPRW